MATVTGGPSGLDVNDIDVSALSTAAVVQRSATEMQFELGGGQVVTVSGDGFTYDATGVFAGGEVTGMSETSQGQVVYQVTGLSVAATDFAGYVAKDTAEQARVQLFNENDTLIGTANAPNFLNGYGSSGEAGANSIVGGAAADTITAAFGADSVFGGGGDDSINMAGSYGGHYIRGGDGADTIVSPAGAVDINGNQGNDSIAADVQGGTILGGQGDDIIHVGINGGAPTSAVNIVNGNLGNDTISAYTGYFTLRGGQGDDSIQGGGHDDIYGDRGDDTLAGGQGFDTFHFAPGGGHDLITNFDASHNDVLELDGATNYTVSQVGTDTVVDLGNGDQITLAGVSKSALPDGWIVLHA